MKKQLVLFLCTLSVASTLFMSGPSHGYETELATMESSQILAEGITYTQMERLTDAGWFRFHVTRVDLNQEGLEPRVLIPDHISDKKTLSQLAEKEGQVVSAINGDFFDPAGKSTLGMIVKDGQFVTTGIHDDRFHTLALMNDDRMHLIQPTSESLRISNGRHTLNIEFKNKPYAQYDRAILLDQTWDSHSIGNGAPEPVVELVVVNNVVREIRENASPISIPKDGYIVTAVGKKKEEILANYAVGDTISYTQSPYVGELKEAIGGGAALVKNGQVVTDFSLDVAGRHPRTAVGFSKDYSQMILVAIDGRHGTYQGYTQTELAYLMAELGAWNAINMDGGGSTAMVLRDGQTGDLEVINTPSDGGERRIHNGLGIVSTQTATGLASRIQFDPVQEVGVIGLPIPVKAIGYDGSGLAVPTPVTYSFSGVDGTYSELGFIPQSPGLLTIKANVHNRSEMVQVKIAEGFADIQFSPSTLRLKAGEKAPLSIQGVTADGFTFPIPIDKMQWIIPGHLGTLEAAGQFVAKDTTGSGFIRGSYLGHEVYLPVAVGDETVTLYDFETPIGEDTFTFASWPLSVEGSVHQTKFPSEGSYGGQLMYDFRGTNDTRAAYMVFGQDGLDLPSGSTQLSLDVFGDYGNGHWLRGKITDGGGETYTIDFTRHVDWKGWQTVTSPVPTRAVEPLTLDRVYLVETDRTIKDVGTIVLDNLQVTRQAYPPTPPVQVSLAHKNPIARKSPLKLQGQSDTIELELPEAQNFYIREGIPLPGEELEDYSILSLNVTGGKMDLASWQKILSELDKVQKPGALKPVVLHVNTLPSWKHEPSQRLFEQTLRDLNGKVPVLVLVPGLGNKMQRTQGYWTMTYDLSTAETIWIGYDRGFVYDIE